MTKIEAELLAAEEDRLNSLLDPITIICRDAIKPVIQLEIKRALQQQRDLCAKIVENEMLQALNDPSLYKTTPILKEIVRKIRKMGLK